jgi:phosphohistidine phosphatase SixA
VELILIRHAIAGKRRPLRHEPDLGRLLAHCLPGGMRVSPVEFRKGAAACVCFGDAIGAGQGTLHWLLPPRVLRKLADRRVGH